MWHRLQCASCCECLATRWDEHTVWSANSPQWCAALGLACSGVGKPRPGLEPAVVIFGCEFEFELVNVGEVNVDLDVVEERVAALDGSEIETLLAPVDATA